MIDLSLTRIEAYNDLSRIQKLVLHQLVTKSIRWYIAISKTNGWVDAEKDFKSAVEAVLALDNIAQELADLDLSVDIEEVITRLRQAGDLDDKWP